MRSLAPLALLAVLGWSSSAYGDLPPPQGDKYVPFTFTVFGVKKVTDQVVFAYPCGTSNGAPQDAVALVEEGTAIPVGKRGGKCTLYTTSKAKYDAYVADYKEPAERIDVDPKMKALADASVLCTGAPKPAYILRERDPATKIEEVLDVITLDATTCTIKTRSTTPIPPVPGTVERPPAGMSEWPSETTPPTASDEGCSTTGRARDAAPWLMALVVPLFAFATRRRKDDK